MKRLAIIGSNDLAQLIAHHAVNDGKYKIAGFFDNKKEVNTPIGSFGKVVGTVEEVEPLFQENFFDELIIGVGYTQFDFKKDVFNRFNAKIPMANIIHSSAYVDKSCKIGQGVVVLPGCILDTGVELEDNVLLNTSVSISHDSKVRAHSFIAPRVNIAGYVTVGSLCFIGIGTTIINNVEICDQVIIGGASLVLKNIVEPGIYYGHPVTQKPNKLGCAMNPIEAFKNEVTENILELGEDKDVQALSRIWLRESGKYKYTYNFSWLGRPIIQYPQDMVAMQELIWSIKPDLIIETGIAHGGSLIFSASMLAQLDMCDAIEAGVSFNPKESRRKVLGIDIDIRAHNRTAIAAHPMASRIQMIQGSSIAPEIIEQVHAVAANYSRVLVCLDSNHTHDHVLAELQAYALLASKDSYCVVFDTVIEDMPKEMFPDRPWGPGNNPKTAVWEYLKTHPEFEIDKTIQHKLLITVAPDGYLKRIR